MFSESWKRFYLGKPREGEGKGWLTGTQLILMTSSGRLLSGSMKYGDKDSLGPALREVLEAYAKLPEEERRPKSVEGEPKPPAAPPSGGLVLTIYDRPLGRDADGDYRLPKDKDLGGFRTHAPHGQRSSLWLTEKEWRSLIPEEAKKGQSHAVPAKLAKRIALFGLWPNTLWVVTHQWQADSVRDLKLDLTVEEVTDAVVRMRIHGSVLLTNQAPHFLYPTGKIVKELENRYEARLEGELVYDRKKKEISKWTMTALGDYCGTWFAGNDGWKEATADAPAALGFVFELDQSDYEAPPERRRPKSFVHSYIFREREKYYWDPETWEEDWTKRPK